MVRTGISDKTYLLLILLLAGVDILHNRCLAQDTSSDVFSPGFTYTADIFSNLSGGIDTGVRYMDNLDIEVGVDLDEGLGFSNTELFIYGLANQGGHISELSGDVQGVSNIEAETSWRFYEVWVQKHFVDLRSSVLVGLYDLNSEFDVIRPASLFINSSHGMGADYALSGVSGPSSFPLTSMALRVRSNPISGFVLKAAVFDGIPSDPENIHGTRIYFREDDGLLFSGEIALYSNSGNHTQGYTPADEPEEDHRFRFALGGWIYTQERMGWNNEKTRDQGFYIFGEYQLYKEPSDPAQGLSTFLRFGIANENINRIKSYTGAGLVYTGLLKNRSEDQAGIAIATPLNSRPFERIRNESDIESTRFEMNVELTYLMTLNSHSSIQFDLQYIVNPNMIQNHKNAVVAGIRIVLSL